MNPLEHIPEEVRKQLCNLFSKKLDDKIESINHEQLACKELSELLKQMNSEVKNIMPNKDED